MRNKSLIDDVRLKREYSDNGPPVLFTNKEIRMMLKLANAGEDDIFFDLGCGWAHNLIIAVMEFNVKKCFGIERLKTRYFKAKERVRQWSLSDRIRIIKGQFEDLVGGKIKGVNIGDATIILYALETDKEFLEKLSGKVQKGCRFVYYYNGLFPEIKPDAADYPFYLSRFPFKRPRSELDWLRSVVRKKKSSLVQNKKPTAQELWDELYHDYDVMRLNRKDVTKYRRRLTEFLKTSR